MVVDPSQRLVRIRSRTLWFFNRSETISFDRISEVLYSYGQLDPESSMPLSTYQENDLFTVGLFLHGGRSLNLFRFYGHGAFVNNDVFPDWFYWGEIIEARVMHGLRRMSRWHLPIF